MLERGEAFLAAHYPLPSSVTPVADAGASGRPQAEDMDGGDGR
jgi:hypothetical protein